MTKNHSFNILYRISGAENGLVPISRLYRPLDLEEEITEMASHEDIDYFAVSAHTQNLSAKEITQLYSELRVRLQKSLGWRWNVESSPFEVLSITRRYSPREKPILTKAAIKAERAGEIDLGLWWRDTRFPFNMTWIRNGDGNGAEWSERVWMGSSPSMWLRHRSRSCGERTFRVNPQENYRFITDICGVYPDIFNIQPYVNKWLGKVIGYDAELPDGRRLIQGTREWIRSDLGVHQIGLADENHRLIQNYGSSITNEQVDQLVGPFLHFGPCTATGPAPDFLDAELSEFV
jgi:hypothetical protein